MAEAKLYTITLVYQSTWETGNPNNRLEVKGVEMVPEELAELEEVILAKGMICVPGARRHQYFNIANALAVFITEEPKQHEYHV